jgi:hypothetical protein
VQNEWGLALYRLALLDLAEMRRIEAPAGMRSAIERFARAATLDTFYAHPETNWGLAADQLGQIALLDERHGDAERQLIAATVHYARAVAIDAEDAEVWRYWSWTLSDLQSLAESGGDTSLAAGYRIQAAEKAERARTIEQRKSAPRPRR